MLALLPANQKATSSDMSQPNADAQTLVFNQITITFGRPLSPITQTTIRDWHTTDHYLPTDILLALRTAVLLAAYSLL